MLISHFYADPHYGHANVIKYANRPFSHVNEMDETLVNNYRADIRDDDVVLWAGDVAFMSFSSARELLRKLPGHKLLVRGNHDPSVAQCLKLGFELVTEKLYLSILGHKITVCHYPPAGTSQDPRYFERRPPEPEKGEYLIHGHTHEKQKMVGRRIHVGVDAWDFRPAPLHEIVKMIADANPAESER